MYSQTKSDLLYTCNPSKPIECLIESINISSFHQYLSLNLLFSLTKIVKDPIHFENKI